MEIMSAKTIKNQEQQGAKALATELKKSLQEKVAELICQKQYTLLCGEFVAIDFLPQGRFCPGSEEADELSKGLTEFSIMQAHKEALSAVIAELEEKDYKVTVRKYDFIIEL